MMQWSMVGQNRDTEKVFLAPQPFASTLVALASFISKFKFSSAAPRTCICSSIDFSARNSANLTLSFCFLLTSSRALEDMGFSAVCLEILKKALLCISYSSGHLTYVRQNVPLLNDVVFLFLILIFARWVFA